MGKVYVKVNGALRKIVAERGVPYEQEIEIADTGIKAYELARGLGLPTEKVEAVFRNGKIINIYDTIEPGDRVAFFPFGTPGPYRIFLGMLRENIKRKRVESDEG